MPFDLHHLQTRGCLSEWCGRKNIVRKKTSRMINEPAKNEGEQQFVFFQERATNVGVKIVRHVIRQILQSLFQNL